MATGAPATGRPRRRRGIGQQGDSAAAMAGKFIQAIVDMRREDEPAAAAKGFEASDIPGHRRRGDCGGGLTFIPYRAICPRRS